jgi:cytochrome c oxidase assembly factor CtaG/cytochrome c2
VHEAADALFAAHMLQHLLLVAAAAPLLAAGTPAVALLAALPRAARPWLTWQRFRLVRAAPTVPGVVIALVAWLVHVTVVWLWHAPRLYAWGLQSSVAHATEHASLLITAWAFWAVVLHPRHQVGVATGMLYLFAAAAHCATLGALLTLADTPWYAVHATTTAVWGMTPLEDQQLAGLIMWVPGGMIYAGVALGRLAGVLHRFAVVLALMMVLPACGRATPTEHTVIDGDAARGRRAFTAYGCGACHVVPGLPGARGRVGPSLAGIAERPYVAGRLVNHGGNLAAWVRHPRRIDPQTLMPDLGVTDADARDIAAFLYRASGS